MLAKQVEGLLFFADCRFISFHSSIKSTSISTSDLASQGMSKGWCSGESARLRPVWSGFESQRLRNMWVEFVVGSLLCSERIFPGTPVFPSPQKQHFQN